MRPDPGIIAKALAAACESLRPGSAADAVGGITPSFVASPSSVAEASAVLRAAAEQGLAVIPRGSGSRLEWGAPASACDLVVDTLGLGQVIEHAVGDLVARVQAGARFGDVASVLARAGQEIALDVPATATIGGIVADALAGPRRLRYGSPRDLLIGMTLVRADGTVAHSGGKVVKNVAGYDLGKLLAGSAGTLGLIVEATFRLHPLPAARAWVTAEFPDAGALARAVAAAANSSLVASAVEVHWAAPAGPASVGVLLEGSADGVAARAGRMAGLLSPGAAAMPDDAATRAAVSPTAPSWWAGVPAPGDGTLLRVTFWVSALERVLGAIDGAARQTGIRPVVHGSAGAGLLYVTVPGPAGPAKVAQLAGIVAGAIPAGRGSVAVVAGQARERRTSEVPGAALMRSVKDRFDPRGRLSPGRTFG
ncbi:MAG TPA: FAD-binding oxidoreductase [Trebonia sp.]|nr:FAD-binding oxidoreductase [Trebonia sp.]